MKNKLLIKVYVPSIDETFDIYIPSNETISKVLELILKSISDLVDVDLNINQKHYLLDPNTSIVYELSSIVREINVKNNQKLILL